MWNDLGPARGLVRGCGQLSNTHERFNDNEGPREHEGQAAQNDWDAKYDILPPLPTAIHPPFPESVQWPVSLCNVV